MKGSITLLVILFSAAAYAQDNAWGDKPVQADAERLATEALGRILKDPYSAHYRWDSIQGTSRWSDDGPPCFGWVLRGYVNAKNSYGGYVGEKDYQFFIRDGQVDCVVTKVKVGRRYPTYKDMRVF